MPTPEEIKNRILEKKGLLKPKRKFILVTSYFDGGGFAYQEIQQNKSEVIVAFKTKEPLEFDEEENYAISLENMVSTVPLDEIMKQRADYKDWYWVFDSNHNVDIGETLIKEGFKVWNGSQFQYDLENDREFGLEFAEEAGLHSPPHEEFNSAEEGIKYLEDNEDLAFVVKPNGAEDAALTQPFSEVLNPKEANIQARKYIQSLDIQDFILQERKKGVEVNTEIFFSHGEPVFAQANLECKRRYNGDMGYMSGCSMDVCWKIPLKSKLVEMTVGKFIPKMKELEYTGFMDANVIIGDDEVWFLEFCARTGYNAHPNFFTTIARKTYLQTIADLIDGVPFTDAKDGFGASITLFASKEHKGVPIYVPEVTTNSFYPFFVYKDVDDNENEFRESGYSCEIGIMTGRNFTVASAFHDAIENAEGVIYINRDYRTDGDKTHFPTSPIRRYEALQAMRLL